MLGSRPLGPHSRVGVTKPKPSACGLYPAVDQTKVNRFLNCVHHLQAPPASDVTLHIQERNSPPPSHQAIVEIFSVDWKMIVLTALRPKIVPGRTRRKRQSGAQPLTSSRDCGPVRSFRGEIGAGIPRTQFVTCEVNANAHTPPDA